MHGRVRSAVVHPMCVQVPSGTAFAHARSVPGLGRVSPCKNRANITETPSSGHKEAYARSKNRAKRSPCKNRANCPCTSVVCTHARIVPIAGAITMQGSCHKKIKNMPLEKFRSAQAERKNDFLLTNAPGPIRVFRDFPIFFICLLSSGILGMFSEVFQSVFVRC